MIRVLFIEDKPTDALLMQTFLRGSKTEKFTLHLTSSLCSGTSLLKRKEFDVILLSLELRDVKNVKDAISLLRTTNDIPIIVCTDSRDENLKFSTLNSGAYGFVVKNQIQVRLLIDQIKFVVETFKRSSKEYLLFSRNLF